MSAEFDDLGQRMSDLEGEVSHIRMAGPTAARRRGRARSRNKASMVALLAASAVTVGAFNLDGLPQAAPLPDPADTPDAAPNTPDPTPTPTPDALPSEPPTGPDSTVDVDLAALEAMLLDGSEANASLANWLYDEPQSWSAEQRVPNLECFPTQLADADGVSVYLASDLSVDAGVFEQIYSFATADDAEAAMAAFRSEIGQCATDRDDVSLDFTWDFDHLGDAAFQSHLGFPEIEDINAGHLGYFGAVRSGSLLAVVAYDYYTQEWNGVASRLIEATGRKLCGDECVADAVQRRTYPSYELASEPFPDDFFNAPGTSPDDNYYRSDDVSHNADAYCMPGTGVEGAVEILRASWQRADGAASFHELLIEFSDDQAAIDFVDRFAELPDECVVVLDGPARHVTIQPTVYPSSPKGGIGYYSLQNADSVRVWAVESSEEPSFAGAGMSRLANFVVVVGFNGPSDPSEGANRDWVQFMGARVDEHLASATEEQ